MPRNGAVMLLAGLLLAGGEAGAAGPPPLDTTRDLLRYCEGTAINDTAQQDQVFCDGFITGTGLFYLELVRAGVLRPDLLVTSTLALDAAPRALAAMGGAAAGAGVTVIEPWS